jgi:hypothetical protein
MLGYRLQIELYLSKKKNSHLPFLYLCFALCTGGAELPHRHLRARGWAAVRGGRQDTCRVQPGELSTQVDFLLPLADGE